MEQYTVTGMSCAACSARVEKAVSKVPGVTELFRQPSDQLDGSGGNGFVPAGDCGGRSGRIWRVIKGQSRKQKQQKSGALYEEMLAGQGDAGAETKADCLAVSADPADVCVYGTYDVGLATAVSSLMENHVAMGLLQLLLTVGGHGNQPEIFYQWI